MSYFVTSWLGGMFGVATALAVGFILMRAFVAQQIVKWTANAHKTGKCPICDKPQEHDRFIGDDVKGGG